jgi:hypothetical protein
MRSFQVNIMHCEKGTVVKDPQDLGYRQRRCRYTNERGADRFSGEQRHTALIYAAHLQVFVCWASANDIVGFGPFPKFARVLAPRKSMNPNGAKVLRSASQASFDDEFESDFAQGTPAERVV